MSFDGSGNYTVPAGTQGVSLTTIDVVKYNALLADLEAALSNAITRDGQSAPTANLPMGGFKLTNLGAGTATGNSLRWEQLFSQGAETDIASAATCDIGAVNSNFLRVTGTTGITSFGTNYNGPRFIRFAGVVTLTYNATTLITPNAANYTSAANTIGVAWPVGGSSPTGWIFYPLYPEPPVPAVESSSIPAYAMSSRPTNGPSIGMVETATNKVVLATLDFDATTAEYAQFAIKMPKSWDEGTITFNVTWSHPATATNFGVTWKLRILSRGDADAMDTAFGTAVAVSDTGGTTDMQYVTADSTVVTPSGTPTEKDWLFFELFRDPADGSDTLAVDARLHGVEIKFTRNSWTDA